MTVAAAVATTLTFQLNDQINVGDEAFDRFESIAQRHPFTDGQAATVEHRVFKFLDQRAFAAAALLVIKKPVEREQLVQLGLVQGIVPGRRQHEIVGGVVGRHDQAYPRISQLASAPQTGLAKQSGTYGIPSDAST